MFVFHSAWCVHGCADYICMVYVCVCGCMCVCVCVCVCLEGEVTILTYRPLGIVGMYVSK